MSLWRCQSDSYCLEVEGRGWVAAAPGANVHEKSLFSPFLYISAFVHGEVFSTAGTIHCKMFQWAHMFMNSTHTCRSLYYISTVYIQLLNNLARDVNTSHNTFCKVLSNHSLQGLACLWVFLGCASFYSGQKRICEELVSLQNPLVLRLEDSSFRSQSSFRESKLDNCVSMLNHRMLAVLRLYSERAAQLLVMLLANIEPKEVQVCSSVL